MDATGTRIRLCGTLEVELDGRRVEGEVRGAQGRLLLAYLVLHRDRAVRRDELEEALWEGGRPASPDALAPPLSRLRRTLGAGRLTGRTELRLLLDAGAWVDVEAAHAALAAARAALDAGDARAARASAQDAAGIAAGELLPGHDASWLAAHRDRLRELRVEALELAAAAGTRIGAGALPAAERAAREAVALAPFRESARVVLLEALRARGNVAEALRAYEDARVLLREELGATPGPALLAAHENLLRLEPPGAPAPRTPPAGPARRRPAHGRLVERDREAAQLRAIVDALAAGAGGVAIIEGAAGIGKTRLLDLARAEARAAGALVLTGRGSELERAFGFGVVRQLLEGTLADPGERARLLAGAAAPVAAVFDAPAAAGEAQEDVSFAVLHGLYWLVLELAADRPVALLVDDVQWADPPSLRALAHLTRRLQDTPVLLLVTVRSTAPDADAALVVDITHDPAAEVVRPGPLSEAAVAEVVAERLGAPAHPAFATACRRTTGGNPLLLGQLLAALAADGVAPDATSVRVVAEVGPRAVSHSVLARIARHGPEAGLTARAVAVLGDGAELPAVAALAALHETAAAGAVRALVRAEVLRGEPPLAFVHPLVRDAVYHGLPPGERDLLHARAAEVLRDRGASAEQVAGQLLRASGQGEAWVVAVLREAAAGAIARGASDSAVPLLARALAEPPPPDERAGVLRDLGTAEVLAGSPGAVEHLAAAAAELGDPDERARTTRLLAETMLFAGDPVGAVAVARAAREALPAGLDARREELLAFELAAVYFGGDDPARLAELEPWRRRPVPPGDGARMLAALAALRWSQLDGTATEVAALALEALGSDRLGMSGLVGPGAAHTLVCTEHPDALAICDAMLADAHRRGSIIVLTGTHLFRGLGLLRRGDLDEAEASLCAARELLRRMEGGAIAPGYVGAFLSRTLLERGDLEAAERVLAETADVPLASEGGRHWMEARLAVLVTAGDDEAALRAAAELAGHPLAAACPGATERRSLQALALARLGRLDEARALAHEELALARRWGAPGVVGRALRMVAAVEEDGRVEHLREAVAVLRRGTARLEEAKALGALGRALDDPAEAGRMLASAAELAGVCGADGLARELEADLAALGGASAAAETVLTARERRLLALQAEGLDERAMAQALFLTPHDVRLCLARASAKQGAEPRALAAD